MGYMLCCADSLPRKNILGAGPSMEVCDGQNDLQHWHHDVLPGGSN